MNKKTNEKSATEAATSGKMGELEWNFADGVLTISGDGEIPDYDDYKTPTWYTPDGKSYHSGEHRSPWYPFREQIIKIVFKGNITKKGVYVFYGCENCTAVTFENRIDTGSHLNNEITIRDIIDRALQGYALVDIYSIKDWFPKQMYLMLREFRGTSYGCVPNWMSVKEWDAILERMCFCFKEANEKTCSEKNEFEEECINRYERNIESPELLKSYEDKEEEIESYRKTMLNEGLELFRKHFQTLWF
jgi:hypothetical protein